MNIFYICSHIIFPQDKVTEWSNVETVLRGEGIVLRDSVNEFRNFGEVLDEVAGRWTSFSEVSQRAIASAFAGTHHMNEFIILMENYGKAVEYSEISMESSGQAMEKFVAYEDTITAHTEKFKNAYQEMAKELLDCSVVKAFVDLGTGATILVKELGLLGSIGLGAGIFAGFKNVGKRRSTMFHNCFEYADRDRCSLYKIGFLSPIVKYTLVNEATISVEII